MKNVNFVWAIVVVIVSLITGFVIINVTGHDTNPMVEYIKWIVQALPTAILLLIGMSQNGKIAATVNKVEGQTNGALKDQFIAQTEEIKTHVDSKIAAVTEQVRAAGGTPFSPMIRND